MNRAKAMGLVGLAVSSALAGPLAIAQDSGWYGGLNLGQSRSKIDDPRIINGLLAGGFSSATITDDNRDRGGKIFGGYQLNRYFGVEGGYFELGEFGFTANTVPIGTLTGDIKIKGVNLDLVGTLPFTEKFSAFGRVGVTRAEARDTFSGTGLVRLLRTNASQRETNAKVGMGLQYAFTDRLGLRAEVERYRINDAVGNNGDIDLVSLGLVYRFGSPRPAPTYVARAPDPTPPPRPAVVEAVVPAPTAQPASPPPSPPPLPTPVQPTRVSFSADALFDFDKAIIKPDGKQALDKFANSLRGTRYDVINVTGHTDRIGSKAYNAALSARRAEAVKSYLVDPAGISAAKITFKGMDESQPVTKPGDCKGDKPSKSLIACLQPDRRVDVEVTATK